MWFHGPVYGTERSDVRNATAPDLRPDAATVEVVPSSRPAAFIRAMRPQQWAKNVLVFAAPGAAGVLAYDAIEGRAFAAFVAFCVVASATYLVNDVLDAPFDRQHPTKHR